MSTVLGPSEKYCYQSLIGVARWMVEIGYTNINNKVSLLSSYLAMPREWHLEAALHITGFLKVKHNPQSAFNPIYPDINYNNFQECNWTDFY